MPEGEDPFAKESDETMSKAEAAAEAKAWIGSDRDYTYTVVGPVRVSYRLCR